MIKRTMSHFVYVLFLSSFMMGLSPAFAQTQTFKWPSVEMIVTKSLNKNTFVAQSGSIKWTLSDATTYLKRYRAWLSWETSAPQPLSVLNDLSALRRILITALEREVIVQYAKEHITMAQPVSHSSIRSWLSKLIPGAMRPSDQGLDDFIRGRLKLKAESDLSFFWQAAQDAYLVKEFKQSLVNQLDESEAKTDWRRQGTLISVYLMQVPRVPTSSEISKAKSKYPQKIKKYYHEHLNLFSQPLRLLVDPYWVQGGKTETQRLEAMDIRNALVSGEALDIIKERYPQLKKGSPKTLRGRSIPKDTKIKEGATTPIRLTRYGWTFYTIKRIYPKYQRSLLERSVEREVAAAVLREVDDLPRAQKLANKGIELLTKTDQAHLNPVKKWSRTNRVRVSQPNPFFASQQRVVPSIGLAQKLHDALFKLQVGEVTPIFKVRQHYVIAKLLEKKEQSESWEEVRQDFLKSWTTKKSGQILDKWLTQHLKDKTRWVSSKNLKNFPTDPLRFESELEPVK
ncbi:MAG: hypothetical protein CMH49_00800 [Myxococcales bacterium]|nr:hypothetical protein [Myxococcales bacterium]